MATVLRVTAALLILLGEGCIVAPLKVAESLRVTVVDDKTGNPINRASVLYYVCDIHDRAGDHALLVRAASDASGKVKIDGRRKWGVWIPAPGGLPVPNHLIAIWAPGHSAFVFAQYDETVENAKRRVQRADVLAALNEIPQDHSSSSAVLNPPKELTGGKIRLRRTAEVAADTLLSVPPN